jgi:hypothetical protein
LGAGHLLQLQIFATQMLERMDAQRGALILRLAATAVLDDVLDEVGELQPARRGRLGKRCPEAVLEAKSAAPGAPPQNAKRELRRRSEGRLVVIALTAQSATPGSL